MYYVAITCAIFCDYYGKLDELKTKLKIKWLSYSRQIRIHPFTPLTLQQSLQSCRNAALPLQGQVLLLGDLCHAYGFLWSLLSKAAPNPHVCSLKRSRSIACSLGVNPLKKGAPLDERCPPSNTCVSTITCPDVLHLLKKVVVKPQPEGGNYFSSQEKDLWGKVPKTGLLSCFLPWSFPQHYPHQRCT